MPEKRSTFFNRLFLLSFVLLMTAAAGAGQSDWKLTKSKNGINVYTSSVANSSFKAVKVECTISGTYAKLMALLQDVDGFEDWIYKNKKSKILKKNSPNDFIYYSETSMPIPFSNRDVVISNTIDKGKSRLKKIDRFSGIS